METDRIEDREGLKVGFDRADHGFSRLDLDALGERAVRDGLRTGKYGHEGLPVFEFVSAWVADAEFVRSRDDAAKRDAREERTLSLAKWANIIAVIAAITAIAAIAIAI